MYFKKKLFGFSLKCQKKKGREPKMPKKGEGG